MQLGQEIWIVIVAGVVLSALAFAHRQRQKNIVLIADLASARQNLDNASHENARHFHSITVLNEQIAALNVNLASKLKELETAQNDINSKGKMAQLGHLVATVAHELRNP